MDVMKCNDDDKNVKVYYSVLLNLYNRVARMFDLVPARELQEPSCKEFYDLQKAYIELTTPLIDEKCNNEDGISDDLPLVPPIYFIQEEKTNYCFMFHELKLLARNKMNPFTDHKLSDETLNEIEKLVKLYDSTVPNLIYTDFLLCINEKFPSKYSLNMTPTRKYRSSIASALFQIYKDVFYSSYTYNINAYQTALMLFDRLLDDDPNVFQSTINSLVKHPLFYAVLCLKIASTFEFTEQLYVRRFMERVKDVDQSIDLLERESRIYNALDYDVLCATPLRFILILAKRLKLDDFSVNRAIWWSTLCLAYFPVDPLSIAEASIILADPEKATISTDLSFELYETMKKFDLSSQNIVFVDRDFITNLNVPFSQTPVAFSRTTTQLCYKTFHEKAKRNLGRQLGQGAFGTVYTTMDEEYVVKHARYRDGLGLDHNIIAEISILKQLNHINVINMVDAKVSSKETTYTLEKAKTDLYSVYEKLINTAFEKARAENPNADIRKVERQTKVSLPLLKYYLYQILAGLRYCHNRNIFHSDIKPENILVFEDDRVVIADFGLALFDNEKLFKMPAGTLAFMPPECLILMQTGGFYNGSAVDIWSFGTLVTFFFISNGLFSEVKDITMKLRYMAQIFGPLVSSSRMRGLPAYNPTDGMKLREAMRHRAEDAYGKENGGKIYEFVLDICKLDPKQRPSAEELMNHRFLREGKERYIAKYGEPAK